MELYVFHEDQQSGPFPLEAVRQMVQVGTLPETVLVWYEGAPDWLPLHELQVAEPAAEAAPPGKPVAVRLVQRDAVPTRPIPALEASSPQITAPALSFFGALPGSFAYPFRRQGMFLLVVGALFFGALDFLKRLTLVFPLIGLVLWLMLVVISTGYLYSCMQGIIVSSARGDDAMPAWPEFSDLWEDIIRPFLQFLVIVLLCFGVGVWLTAGGLFMKAFEGSSGTLILGIGLLLLGSLYFPMALLAMAMADSLTGLNPMLVIPSILRVPLQYLVTCVLLWVLFVVGPGTANSLKRSIPVPFVGWFVSGLFGMYLLTVEMRVLGLLYHTNHHKLRWF